MALRFYKNLKGTNLLSKGEFDVRFEIHDRDFSGNASEIPHMGSIPLSITWGNSGDRATEAIKKTSLKFSIVKEDGIDYSFFYTSDAKKYRVVVSSGQLNWQGYIAQDSYFEDLIYKGEIAITAIDNLSYLESSKFTLTGFQKVQDIIAHCVSDTGIDKAILYDDSFLTSNNTKFNLWQSDVSHLSDSSKLEALESILLSLGLRIEQTNTNWRVSSMYERRFPTKIVQSSWLGKLDTKELVPAKKEIRFIQSLNTPSLYEMPTEDDYIPTTFQPGTPHAFVCSKLANTFGTLAMKQWNRTGAAVITSYSYTGCIFGEESSNMRVVSVNEATDFSSAPISFLPIIKVAKPDDSLYISLKLNPEISAVEQSISTSYSKPFTYLPTWIKFNFIIKLDGKYLDSSNRWVATKSIRSVEIKNIATSGALDVRIKIPNNTSISPMQNLEIGIMNCTDSESHKKIINAIKFASIENISIYDKRNDDVPYLSNILTATGKDRNVNEEIDTDFCMCPIASQSAFMQYRNAFYFSDFNPVLTVNSEHLITAIGKQFLIEQYDPMSRYSGNVYFNGYGAATPFNLRFNFHGEICEPNGVTLNVCKMQLSGEFTELKTYQSGDNLGYSITTKSSKSEGGKGTSGGSTGGSGSGSGSGSVDSGVISEILDQLENKIDKSDIIASTDVETVLTEANVYSSQRSLIEDDKRLPKSDVLSSKDTAAPLSESNVYSSIRSNEEDNKRLRKDVPDTAEKLITFLEGIKTGDMRSLDYLYNAIGWAMNKEGDLDARSAILRKSLTVPQIIFDTIKAVGGKFWFTDTHTIAKVTRSGSTYLCEVDLQPNTHCTWDKDDCLTGILHTTDAEGNFNGFQTVECLVISVENDIATLAPRVEALPPSVGLVLNRCGNITNVKRQSSVFLSAEMGGYVTLVNMNSWTIGRNNIGAATGDLSKLASIISMPELNGMSMLAKNVVLYGKYYQIDDITGDYHPVPNFQKEWVQDRVYSYYDEVTHLGRRFLCIDEKGCVGVEPYKGSAVWVCTVDKGEDGDKWNYCDKWDPAQEYKRGDVVLYGRDTYMYQWHEPSKGYYPDAAEYYPVSIKDTVVRVMNTQGVYVDLAVKTQRNRVWALMSKGGLDGDAAFSKQYSPDKVIIHNEYIEGDVWSRDKVNTGDWSIWYRIKGESANEPNFMFKYSSLKPTLPSATASIEQMKAAGWHDVPPTPRPEGQNLYQVYAKFNEYGNIIASWSEPYTPDGKDGVNGESILVQYATAQNSNDWHFPFRSGDEWERQSIDGGKTWTIPFRCVGEKGDQGDLAPYVENQYIKHESWTTPPHQSSSGWQDAPFLMIEEGVYIWKRERKVTPPTPAGSWGAPYVISGSKGQDGESMSPKGDWKVNVKYYKNDVVTYNGCTFIAVQDVPYGKYPVESVYRSVTSQNASITIQGNSLTALTSGSDYWQKLTDKALDVIAYGLDSSVATVVFNSLGNPTPTAYSVYLKKLVNGSPETAEPLWLATRYFDGVDWRRHSNTQLATSTSVTVRADAQQYETRVYAGQFDAEDWKDNFLAKSNVARIDSGKDGDVGSDGLTPEIRSGYWWIGNTNTGIKAQAADGITPHIGSNGNWWVDNQDTGIPATGPHGDRGPTGSMPRPCGFFTQGTTYMWDSKFQDWVIHPIGGINYQFMVRTFGATVTAAPTSAEGDANWDVASKTKFVATDTALIDKANIAGFIYYNDYMISQWGKLNGVKKHVSELLTSADWAAFVPNIKLDGKIGEVIGAGGQFMVDQDGNITAKSGTFGFMGISDSSIKSTNIELTNRALPSLQDMSQATDTHPVTTSTKSGSGNLNVEVSTSIANIYLSKPQVISLVANGECYSSDRNYQSIFSFAQVSVTDAQGINMGSQTVAHGATSEEDVFSRGASFTLPAGRYTVHLTGNANIMQADKAVTVTAKMTITNLRIEAISSTTLIGNNGFASHFASDKYIYFNSQEKIELRFGNYGLQLTETGLRKMTNGSSWVTL